MVVQVNGKVRDRVLLPQGASESAARQAAMALPRVQELTAGTEPRRVIVVPGKLVNIVL